MSKTYRVRLNRETGRLVLTKEPYAAPMRVLRDITDEVILALASDLTQDDAAASVVRRVKFNQPGEKPWAVKITVEFDDE